MKRPWYYYPSLPIHWATRGWLKRHCWMCCDEGDEKHVGMAAILTWLRDRSIRRRSKWAQRRMKHPRLSRFLCRLGKHEAYRLPDKLTDPWVCVRCGRSRPSKIKEGA